MRAWTRSLLHSTAAGALLAALALVVRPAPLRSSAAAPLAPSPPRPSSEPAPSAPAAASVEPAGADGGPAAPAACPEALGLVAGDFCPPLPRAPRRPPGA